MTVCFVGEEVVQFDDVFMAQIAVSFYFLKESFDSGFVGQQLGVQYLYGNGGSGSRIERFVDIAHPTSAQIRDRAVSVFEHSTDYQRVRTRFLMGTGRTLILRGGHLWSGVSQGSRLTGYIFFYLQSAQNSYY